MKPAPFWALVLLFALAQPPHAQEKKTAAPPPAPPPGEKTEKNEPSAKQPEKKDEPKESPRLQKLKQLSYDRRPSATLKAWSTPLAKPETKGKEKPDPIDLELALLRRHVTLGNWPAVKDYLAKLPEDEAKAGYKQMLSSLQSGAVPGGPQMGGGPQMMAGMPPQMMQFMERPVFHPDDLLGLAAAAPKGLDKDIVKSLGGITRLVLNSGTVVEHLVSRFKLETAKPKDQAVVSPRQAAQWLVAADHALYAGGFLPTVDQASNDKDHEALNLLVSHYLALHVKERKTSHLEQAWRVTQAALTIPGAKDEDKDESLRRAVELAPRIKEELGQAWLDDSFTKHPERGMDILATIGGQVAQGLTRHPMVPDMRHKALQLQKTAVAALLRAAPDKAKEWRSTLTLLAGAWLKEAEFSHQFAHAGGFGQRMNRDRFGNIFFMSDDPFGPMMMGPQQQNMPRPISLVDIMESRPSEEWLALIEEGMKPKLAMLFAQLYLKGNEEQRAFPHIERLAASNAERAKDLVHEFLRVWTRNHDPNEARRYTNPYMFMYGFERRSESIPLTRSKQERNLVELADWLGRLRKLNVGELDEELVAKAFTTCHSSAEVYRLEAIERVFGPLGQLKPKTLAGLAQQMRENLSGLWREPAEQKDKKTNRKTKDIQAEVLRGYVVAQAVIDNSLKKFPNDWTLHLARAAVLHDENNYRQELAKSSEFSKHRDQALAGFQRAAELYAAAVPKLSEDEESTRVYEQWYYASLGASDLQHVNEEKLPDLRQPALIRKAILGLPGEAAERHLSKFANQLFTRLSSVKPAVKFRYLKHGFDIVGDHKDAREARKLFDYYKDLVREIKLETIIDGGDTVGHKEPFGVFVNLRHTREIERESGGFGRYLQNQNAGAYFYYNYGRPLADYRDKFQAIVKEALQEHFDVLSVTFQTDKVNSRALSEYGWRYTPYAYLLVKAKGPQVDKLPPVRLDLDFLDTSGYVILPIESPALPLDASTASADARPLRKLQITQTLDERQADKGKLILEVKATALGLVPALEQIVDLKSEGFDIVKIDDQGVSVGKFDPDAEQNAIVSERTWMVTLAAKENLGKLPEVFRFAAAKHDEIDMTFQRYRDADLAAAEREVRLEETYGSVDRRWIWWLTGGAALALVALVLSLLLLRRPALHPANDFALPDRLTPFTVIGLLRQIQASGRLSQPQESEMRSDLATLEEHFFAQAENGQLDLKPLAERWLAKTQ
jgi:hypothetical protein